MIYFPVQTFRFDASTSSMIGEMVGAVDVQCDSGESLSTLTILDNTVPFNISASNLRITVADTLTFNKYTFVIKAVSNIGNEATANVIVNVRGGIDPPPPPRIEPSNIGLVFNKFATWAGKALQFAKAPPPVIPSVRVRTSDGNVPKKSLFTTYETATLVPGTTDVYDVYKSGTSFMDMFYGSSNVVEVLGGANTSSITNMREMFVNCNSLTNVALFDTSNVTNMNQMFNGCQSLQYVPLFDTTKVTIMSYMLYGCTSLTNIPLFDTSKVTNMSQMFAQCNWVQSGALALYQQASSQTNPPTNHDGTFTNCGANTTTGLAELQQIPSSWGGYGA